MMNVSIFSIVGIARVGSPPSKWRTPIAVICDSVASITSSLIDLLEHFPLRQCLQFKLHLLVIIKPKFWIYSLFIFKVY